MSNQALYNQYPIKSPRKLASGNRWLNKTRAAIQQEPAPAIYKGALPVHQDTASRSCRTARGESQTTTPPTIQY